MHGAETREWLGGYGSSPGKVEDGGLDLYGSNDNGEVAGLWIHFEGQGNMIS